MRALRALRALLWSWLLVAAPAAAIAPAGGPPGPSEADLVETRRADDAPDASVEDRTWLRQDGNAEPSLAQSSESHSPVLTLLALLLVAGLGAGALWLQRRKRALSPLASADARLTLLSSTRVGPKAFAVSAEVSGRVLLLGVTDHSVTHLAWLDTPEPELGAELSSPEPETESQAHAQGYPQDASDDLPDDYPGSSLRAPSQAGSSSSPSLTSQNLRRFQEVLRGAVPLTSQAGRAPRAAVRASDSFGREPGSAGSDAAATLAAMTSAVVRAAPPSAVRSVAPASLRRKRQRRELEAQPRESRSTSSAAKSSRATGKGDAQVAVPSALEGQVAGLRALKNG